MNKEEKGIKKIDYEEDIAISKVARKKARYNDVYIFAIFLVLIGILVSVLLIKNKTYGFSDNEIKSVENIIVNGDTISIVNSEDINEKLEKNNKINKNIYIVERISSIEIRKKSDDSDSIARYNVKYQITENDFKNNFYASVSSDVLVRFSYSYDKTNWNYVNNVVSTSSNTINPLMGKSYDISGILDTLKVETNVQLDQSKIYWRSETVFQNVGNFNGENYKANFRIEYVDTI